MRKPIKHRFYQTTEIKDLIRRAAAAGLNIDLPIRKSPLRQFTLERFEILVKNLERANSMKIGG